ncbi:serine carboxypeptidase [Cooperia oncophora]
MFSFTAQTSFQGGPGASSTGFGNFEETGPKMMNSTDNMATWLQVADLVYVDNPVGAGFSYVDEESALTTDVAQIGQDLLAWLRYFLVLHSEYRTRPFFIFCESYGGKMSAEFARVITQEVAAGTIRLDFRGVALGDSWISAMDYVNTWGEYLYANVRKAK